MRRRNILGAAALAVGLTLASVSSAFAAVGATLAPGSKAMTLSNSSTLANGLVQSTWDNRHDDRPRREPSTSRR